MQEKFRTGFRIGRTFKHAGSTKKRQAMRRACKRHANRRYRHKFKHELKLNGDDWQVDIKRLNPWHIT